MATSGLRIDMLDLPFAVDAPAGDAVVMLVGERQRSWQRLGGLATRGDELRAQGLRVAGLVPCSALQDRGLAVPAPRHGKTGECLVLDRPLQRRLAPAFAAVRRHHDLGNTTGPRIGDARDRVIAGLLQRMAERWMGDEAL